MVQGHRRDNKVLCRERDTARLRRGRRSFLKCGNKTHVIIFSLPFVGWDAMWGWGQRIKGSRHSPWLQQNTIQIDLKDPRLNYSYLEFASDSHDNHGTINSNTNDSLIIVANAATTTRLKVIVIGPWNLIKINSTFQLEEMPPLVVAPPAPTTIPLTFDRSYQTVKWN